MTLKFDDSRAAALQDPESCIGGAMSGVANSAFNDLGDDGIRLVLGAYYEGAVRQALTDDDLRAPAEPLGDRVEELHRQVIVPAIECTAGELELTLPPVIRVAETFGKVLRGEVASHGIEIKETTVSARSNSRRGE